MPAVHQVHITGPTTVLLDADKYTIGDWAVRFYRDGHLVGVIPAAEVADIDTAEFPE